MQYKTFFNDPVSKIDFLTNTQFQNFSKNSQLQSFYIITLWDRWLGKLTEHIYLLTALFTAALYNDIKIWPEAKSIYNTSDPWIQSGHLKYSKKRWEHGKSFQDSLNVSFI